MTCDESSHKPSRETARQPGTFLTRVVLQNTNKSASSLLHLQRVSHRRSTVLLVCAQERAHLEQPLKAAGCDVVKTKDGETAVARVRRQRFDLAVLASTGETMDMMETVFNIRDIRYAMPILVVRDAVQGQPNVSLRGVRYCSERDLPYLVEAVSRGMD